MTGIIVRLILIGFLFGFLLWLADTYIPMDANIKKILGVVVIILVVLWLLNITGGFAMLGG